MASEILIMGTQWTMTDALCAINSNQRTCALTPAEACFKMQGSPSDGFGMTLILNWWSERLMKAEVMHCTLKASSVTDSRVSPGSPRAGTLSKDSLGMSCSWMRVKRGSAEDLFGACENQQFSITICGAKRWQVSWTKKHIKPLVPSQWCSTRTLGPDPNRSGLHSRHLSALWKQ